MAFVQRQLRVLLCFAAILGLVLLAGLQAFAFPGDTADLPTNAVDKLPPAGWTNYAWQDPGGWTTIDVTQNGLPVNDNTVDAAVKIQDILTANPTGRIELQFPAGGYYFKTDLVIKRGDIRFVGEGADETIFRLVAPLSIAGKILFEGDKVGSPIDLTSAAARGDDTVTVANASTISVGDHIAVHREKYNNGNLDRPIEGQIVRVVAKSGSTLTLDMKLGLSYPVGAKVQKYSLLENVSVEALRIHRRQDNTPVSQNLKFDAILNGRITEIETSYSGNVHINISNSRGVEIRDNKLHHSYDYGAGGHGYNIALGNLSTEVTVIDNKVWASRHHYILANGVNHSVIAFNSAEAPRLGTTNDLDYHGWSPNNNLWESNMGLNLVADARSDSNNNASQGMFTTYFRNWVGNSTSLQAPSTSGNTSPSDFLIVGNITNSLNTSSGSDVFSGTNRVNGSVQYGLLTSSTALPTSLYTSTKPALLGGLSWPFFGPERGVSWGDEESIPARERIRSTLYEVEDIQSNQVTYSGASGQTIVNNANATAGEYRQLNANSTGDYIEFDLEDMRAGDYEISLNYIRSSAGGIADVTLDGQSTGVTIDMYSASEQAATITLGSLSLSGNDSPSVRLTVSGQNASSSGYQLTADSIAVAYDTGVVTGPLAFETEDVPYQGASGTTSILTNFNPSGGEYVVFEGDGVGTEYVEFDLGDIDGDRELTVHYRTFKNGGIAQAQISSGGGAFQDLGSTFDSYNSAGFSWQSINLGSTGWTSDQSRKIRFLITGKATQSTGYKLGLDQITLSDVSSGGLFPGATEAEDLTYTVSGATAAAELKTGASGGEHVVLFSDGVGLEYIQFDLGDITGIQTIKVRHRRYLNGGQAQLQISDAGGPFVNFGSVIEMYHGSPGTYAEATLGVTNWTASLNRTFRLLVSGQNSSSTGYKLSVDRITVE